MKVVLDDSALREIEALLAQAAKRLDMSADTIDLHLGVADRRGGLGKNAHNQKTHGSWGPRNPFNPVKNKEIGRLASAVKKMRAARAAPERSPGRGIFAGVPEQIGEGKNEAKFEDTPERPDSQPIYDKPHPSWTDTSFVLGKRDGKAAGAFWERRDGSLLVSRVVAKNHLDPVPPPEGSVLPGPPELQGIYRGKEGSLSVINVPTNTPSSEHVRMLHDAFPEAELLLWRGKGYEIGSSGGIRERKPVGVEEARKAVEFAEKVTSRESTWTGQLHYKPPGGASGVKDWECPIGIRPDVASETDGHAQKVLLHEAFHSVSNGIAPGLYGAYRGWEEGAVEGAMRAFIPDVAEDLSPGEVRPKGQKRLTESVYSTKGNSYDHFVKPYEAIRKALGDDKKSFYVEMLQTPLPSRHAHLLGRVQEAGMERDEREATFRTIEDASMILSPRQGY